MLATTSRTLTHNWLRTLQNSWLWRLLFAEQEALQPLTENERLHVKNLSGRRYPIPADRAHLYARAADDRL